MPETESGYIPPEAISESEQERKDGVFARINKLLDKYPSLYRTLVAITTVVAMADAKAFLAESPEMEILGPRTFQMPSKEKIPLASQIEKEVGRDALNNVLFAETIEKQEERSKTETLPNKVRVFGFEKFQISNEVIEHIVHDTLPKGFTRNLNSISYRNEYVALPSKYGITSVEDSQEAAHANIRRKIIEVVKAAEADPKSWVTNNMLTHEIFHLQDWESNTLLTVDERLELLQRVIDRVKSPDRFKSQYVEDIQNEDKQIELGIKSIEYFAEIGSTYLSKDFFLLPKADRELIRDLIAKVDPKFDRSKALKERRKLIGDTPPVFIIDNLETTIASAVKNVQSTEAMKIMLKQAFEKQRVAISEEELEKEALAWHEDAVKSAIKDAEYLHSKLLNDKNRILKEYDEGKK